MERRRHRAGHQDDVTCATPVGSLSGRERQVLELLADGQLDESIARKLNISVRTCRRIIASLMDRLEARSRFQAGVIAVARGWMEVPSPSGLAVRPSARTRMRRGLTTGAGIGSIVNRS
ncbi:helix-turn-helix transcriptional regulator [Streptomyces sp. NRRL S-813]|uniref:helix-turn-helix domain-containing protein n=1 Tax=Streptomyces sp. NRRL S-813 TaxID=1463919 RepID=UPI002D21AC3E|nr:helix-turn-helix transcriptional regulator [Streptomyces sp. NRRL S-813]